MPQLEEGKKVPSLIQQNKTAVLKSRGGSNFYGVSDERFGNVIALKFITSVGTQKAIHYHDLVSPMDFNGESEIVLATPSLRIVIIGQNLEKLFNYIIQHRVMWVKEPDSSFTEIEDGDVEVNSIRFEDSYSN